MFRGLLRPGQGFKQFIIVRKENGVSPKGRPKKKDKKPKGVIIGIISQASQSEIAQSKQSGHPITHTIVQRGAIEVAKPTDILVLRPEEGPERKFYVQTVQDPGELGHFTIYKVEERADLQ